MVEPDTPVLTVGARRRLRVESFVVLAVAVGTWYIVAPHLAPLELWPAVTLVALAVLPATLGLIFIALPLWSRRWMIGIAAGFGLVAVLTWKADWHLASNFAKLAAYTCAGWAFLQIFEALSWVILVALIIPFVDTVSVFLPKGPTHQIVSHHFEVYSALAVAFVAPGSGAAYLGPPDILFFALFLATALRWQLRPGWTWLAMTAMYSFTLVLANAADVSGLPALPFVSAGFLLANGDLIWRRLRHPGI